jgi:hypothetical protein
VSSLCDSGRAVIPIDPTSEGRTPLAIFDRLLRAQGRLQDLARRAGDDAVREWAALDAVDLGEQLGLLHDDEAERRREAIRAAVEDLERSPP